MDGRITPINYFEHRESIIPDLWLFLPKEKFKRLFDLFSGSGSLAFAAMKDDRAELYYLNDTFATLKPLWEGIFQDPEGTISAFNTQLDCFASLDEDLRHEYYTRQVQKYNDIRTNSADQREAAQIFAFLINFSKDEVPKFSQAGLLSTAMHANKSQAEIAFDRQDFTTKVHELHELFTKTPFHLTADDFLEHTQKTTPEDLVILDPPYPQQTREIYFNINTERALFDNLQVALTDLTQRGVPTLIMFGCNDVELQNQFRDPKLKMQHLVRVANHPLYGDYLEHFYVSDTLMVNLTKLPPHIARYSEVCDPDVEMTKEQSQEILKRLKTAVKFNTPTPKSPRQALELLANSKDTKPAVESAWTGWTCRIQ